VEYLEYLQSGKRIMLTNFKAGMTKGLGLTLGMSVVLGLFAWMLTLLVDLPIIGKLAQSPVDDRQQWLLTRQQVERRREQAKQGQ
jgi:hypothetical protein